MALEQTREPQGPVDADAAYDREVERRLAKKHRLLDDLDDLLAGMEAVEWRHVPTMSTAEAAALTAILDEAREAVQERGLE